MTLSLFNVKRGLSRLAVMPRETEIPRKEVDGKKRFELLEMKVNDWRLKFGFTRIDDDAFRFPIP